MGYIKAGSVPTYSLSSPYGELPINLNELLCVIKYFNVDIYNAKLKHYTAHSYNYRISVLEIYDEKFVLRISKRENYDRKKSRREILKYELKNDHIDETNLILSYNFDIFYKDFFSINRKNQEQ